MWWGRGTGCIKWCKVELEGKTKGGRGGGSKSGQYGNKKWTKVQGVQNFLAVGVGRLGEGQKKL